MAIRREKRIVGNISKVHYYVDFGDRKEGWYTVKEISEFEECVLTQQALQSRLAEYIRRHLKDRDLLSLVSRLPYISLNGTRKYTASTKAEPVDFNLLTKLWPARKSPGKIRHI